MAETAVPMHKRSQEYLWPLGGTVLALIAMPVAIAQYPEFFNQNRWLLPSSVAAVIICWITPLLIHENAKRIMKWIWSQSFVWKILGIIFTLAIIALIAVGGRTLLQLHTKHLAAALSSKTQSPWAPLQENQPNAGVLPPGSAATVPSTDLGKPIWPTIPAQETVQMADVEADFFNPKDVALAVQNTSNQVANEPRFFVMLYNLDEASSESLSSLLSLPIFTRTDSGFIRPHEGSGGYGIINLANASSRVKNGDHLCGWASVTCANCKNDRFYWIYYVQGVGGWYSETKSIPFKTQSAFTHSIPSNIKEPSNLFSFVKDSARIKIKGLPRF
jgi:hypothetical protein